MQLSRAEERLNQKILHLRGAGEGRGIRKRQSRLRPRAENQENTVADAGAGVLSISVTSISAGSEWGQQRKVWGWDEEGEGLWTREVLPSGDI